MKSKKERLAEAWVHIAKRLPSGTHTEILVWLPEIKETRLGKSMEFYQAAVAMLDPARQKLVAWDKRLSHWMKVVPPCHKEECE